MYIFPLSVHACMSVPGHLEPTPPRFDGADPTLHPLLAPLPLNYTAYIPSCSFFLLCLPACLCDLPKTGTFVMELHYPIPLPPPFSFPAQAPSLHAATCASPIPSLETGRGMAWLEVVVEEVETGRSSGGCCDGEWSGGSGWVDGGGDGACLRLMRPAHTFCLFLPFLPCHCLCLPCAFSPPPALPHHAFPAACTMPCTSSASATPLYLFSCLLCCLPAWPPSLSLPPHTTMNT